MAAQMSKKKKQVSAQEALECGEETSFPALHVGSDKSSSVSFWLDNQARKEDLKNNDSVPLYDREYSLHLTSLDGSANPERIEKEDSRCFNCGSYSHSLKECTKPRDNVAINNARKQHKSKRNQSAGNRGQIRYYQKAPGKFDDLKAGFLGPETRECLGIGEYDPPPWFHRMQEIGYPPGYLDVVEDKDEPSGITIYADEEVKEDYEDGELPERDEPEPPERRMTVEFPGINAPIPENADHKRWESQSTRSGPSSYWSRSHLRLLSPDSHRKRHHDQLRSEEQHEDCPPGAKHGHSMPVYSPRYNPYDYNPHMRSPSLGRSLPDRGWRSPLPYDSSAAHSPRSPHSPYPYQSARRSPQNDSPSHEHWNHTSAYGASTDISTPHGRDRYDHWRDRYDHQRDRYDHQRDRYDHQRDRYDHQRDRYDHQRDRYDHQKDRYDHQRDRYDHQRHHHR
ncbi:uncharacterized protein [Typha latifolia]|uniref:uncharacterized protein isoform X1 n=1 Tax=Typha latifolia TaxID=4733 RepID=UPI003C303776